MTRALVAGVAVLVDGTVLGTAAALGQTPVAVGAALAAVLLAAVLAVTTPLDEPRATRTVTLGGPVPADAATAQDDEGAAPGGTAPGSQAPSDPTVGASAPPQQPAAGDVGSPAAA